MFSITSKIIIVGDINVGKTSILNRYIYNNLTAQHIATIGVDYLIKRINKNYNNNSYELKLQLWDTAGLERFRSITSLYYKGASHILIVFDLSNIESFNNSIKNWLDYIKNNINNNDTKIIFVGNKLDIINSNYDTIINKWFSSNNYPYFKVSQSNIDSINNLFNFIIDDILSNNNKKNIIIPPHNNSNPSNHNYNKCLYFC
jgi:small GTP-binding protein